MNLAASPFAMAIALLAPAVLAQHDPARPDKPAGVNATANAKAPFVFEPGVVDVRTLIQRCATYLQRNILVDDVELLPNRKQRPAAPAAGAAAESAPDGPSIELQFPVVTDREGCEELLDGLLWTRGLAVVPLDETKGVYEVLSLYGPRAREIAVRAVARTPEQVLARPALRRFVTVVHALKHANATVVTNALRPFFAASMQNNVPTLAIGSAGNATSLLLTGPQDLVATALRLLQAADVPQPADARPELEARFDALARQHEQALQRIVALEEKLAKASR
jgi:hypothetical protein